MSRHLTRMAVPCLTLSLTLAACGTTPSAPGKPDATGPGAVETTAGGDRAPRYAGSGTVLQDGRHGPQLCTAVAQSYPPQCGGIDIVGWDWKAVESEAAGDTRWGEYRVVGTWDGRRLTLTETPRRPVVSTTPPSSRRHDPRYDSPCPRPAGGWKPVDPAKATEEARQEAMDRAGKAPEFAGAWIDQAYLDDVPTPQASTAANDPARYVLNLRFTGDLTGRERWIRQVWGGALCVSGAKHAEAELRGIQQKIDKELEGLQSSSVSTLDNRVEALVPVVTDELRRTFDDRYGAGVVFLEGILRPVG
ncbi:hypothetical protein AB0395_15695 [Streptosporangium sp. NPDC051023]|uniref:hypothetical protein n=1 Tax=Streptosporangium sp. NPDC051023 TaxID=3155410 RepID=UPI003450043F